MATADIVGVPTRSGAGADVRGFRESPPDANAAIVLIEHRTLTRQCLSNWLRDGSRGLQVVSFPGTAEMLDCPRLPGREQLILFSIGAVPVNDPDVLGKISLMRRRLERTSILLLSDRDDLDDVVAAIEHGVRGYVTTNLEPSEVVAAVRCVLAGGTFVPASTMIKLAQDRRRPPDNPPQVDSRPKQDLTPREREVLARLREGKPNKIIAHELAISESTVKVFVRRILVKLNASNRTEVACRRSPQTATIGPR